MKKCNISSSTLTEEVTKVIKIMNDKLNNLHQKNFISTDYEELWFNPGELVVLGGEASMGKTSFCFELIRQISEKQHIPVEYITCGKTTPVEITEKLLAINMGISYPRLSHGMIAKSEIEKLQKEVNRMTEIPLFFSDMPEGTVRQVIKAVKNGVKRNKFRMIFIEDFDYLKSNEGSAFCTNLKTLKNLARKLNIVIVVIEKRFSEEEKVPDLYKRYADKILNIQIDKNQFDEDWINSTLWILKNVSGPTLDIELEFSEKKMNFRKRETVISEEQDFCLELGINLVNLVCISGNVKFLDETYFLKQLQNFRHKNLDLNNELPPIRITDNMKLGKHEYKVLWKDTCIQNEVSSAVERIQTEEILSDIEKVFYSEFRKKGK